MATQKQRWRWVEAVLLLVLILVNYGCESCPKADLNAPREPASLIVLDHTAKPVPAGEMPVHKSYGIKEIDPAVQETMRDAKSTTALIVYVHGRAGGKVPEPEKSLREVIPSLEGIYDARVLMFVWPGAEVGGRLGFPECQARAAAVDFASLVSGLQTMRSKDGSPLAGRRIVLMTHSMGSIVLEEFAMRYGSQAPPGETLFNTALICSSASENVAHATWAEKLNIAKNVYITVNDNDPILKLAGTQNIGGRLGKKLNRTFTGNVRLAKGIDYVELTGLSVNHHLYFLNDDANTTLGRFFGTTMVGQPVDWSTIPISSKESRDGAVVYHLKLK